MSDRIINCHQSWEYGRTAGRKEALKNITELHFKAGSNYFIDMLNEIYDDEIIEKLFDSETFWTNYKTRANLDMVMNSIRHANDDYKYKLKKKKETEDDDVQS